MENGKSCRMRKALFCVSALLLAACQQEELMPVEDRNFTATIEEFDAATKTSLNSSNSVVWSRNDMIAIFQGNTMPSLFQVPSASTGSTTATFEEVVSDKRGGAIPANVALYPYSSSLECSFQQNSAGNKYVIDNVVFPEEQAYQKTSFANGAFVMAAVTKDLKDKKLKFRNVSGALRLKVKGDVTLKSIAINGNSGEILAGDASVTVSGDAAPSVKMFSGGSKIVILDCESGIRLSETAAVEFIIALPPTIFSKGFTVTLIDTEGNHSEHKTQKTNTVNRSKILNMPEIVFGQAAGELEPEGCTDISEQGTANCYIISAAGDYSFSAVKGNSTQPVGTVASVEVLWETFGTSVAPDQGDLISEVAYTEGKILLRTPLKFREGNAVIAAKNYSGTILWSWHIWLTDKPSSHIYANQAGTMMDRNLGATSATPGDVEALGLLYQWGRKDPFLGCSTILVNNAPISNEASSTIFWPSAVSSDASRGTIRYSIENPTTYIMSNTSNSDWYYTGDTSIDMTRWGQEKTIYDPCPAGWRVPDGGLSPWYIAGCEDYPSFDDTNGGILFPSVITGTPAWYPATGYRSTNGKLQNTVNNTDKNLACGAYWGLLSDDSEPYIYDFLFTGDGTVISRNYNSPGFSFAVRCYKEGSGIYEDLVSAPVDLNEDGETANSYIVSQSGRYMFKPVKGNSSTSVGTISSVSVLWESYGTNTAPTKGSLIKSVEYTDGKIVFTVPETFREGNAVIAAKNSSGTILWSWHIWLTDKPAEHTYPNLDVMMDRNLGATSSAVSSVGALGLLYQWGRKDPFLGSSSVSSSVEAMSTGAQWPAPVQTSSTRGTVNYTIANPMLYIYGSENNEYDWHYSYRNDQLWDASKTQYDPCPPGWRVPDYMVWAESGFLTDDFSSTAKGVTFNINNPSTTWYPAAGYKIIDLYDLGMSGYFWSVDLQESSPIMMLLTSDLEWPDTYYLLSRHSACSVRCLKY